jgi:hypothetical protein
MELGVRLNTVMEGVRREVNGLGRMRCIVYRGGIGTEMGLNIRQTFGMILFMGGIGIE